MGSPLRSCRYAVTGRTATTVRVTNTLDVPIAVLSVEARTADGRWIVARERCISRGATRTGDGARAEGSYMKWSTGGQA